MAAWLSTCPTIRWNRLKELVDGRSYGKGHWAVVLLGQLSFAFGHGLAPGESKVDLQILVLASRNQQGMAGQALVRLVRHIVASPGFYPLQGVQSPGRESGEALHLSSVVVGLRPVVAGAWLPDRAWAHSSEPRRKAQSTIGNDALVIRL